MITYRYRPDVLRVLLEHGLRPQPHTPPSRVHELLSDLYRYELRRLRERLVRREIPKVGYKERVIALRQRYPLVSLKPEFWIEPSGVDVIPTVQ